MNRPAFSGRRLIENRTRPRGWQRWPCAIRPIFRQRQSTECFQPGSNFAGNLTNTIVNEFGWIFQINCFTNPERLGDETVPVGDPRDSRRVEPTRLHPNGASPFESPGPDQYHRASARWASPSKWLPSVANGTLEGRYLLASTLSQEPAVAGFRSCQNELRCCGKDRLWISGFSSSASQDRGEERRWNEVRDLKQAAQGLGWSALRIPFTAAHSLRKVIDLAPVQSLLEPEWLLVFAYSSARSI